MEEKITLNTDTMKKFTYQNRHESTFYLEDMSGRKIFTGDYDSCNEKLDNLINSSEDGYWTMYDENGDEWQSGGLDDYT